MRHLLIWMVLFTACGGSKIQTVAPEFRPPDASYDFGLVPVLNEKTIDIPLTNVGRAELDIPSVSFIGDAGVFSIKSAPTKIGAGETIPVVVGFIPEQEQAYTAKISITATDEATPSFAVDLTGTGSTKAIASVDPALLTFGRTGECTSSLQTLTVLSQGSADLQIQEIGFVETTTAFSFVGSIKTPAIVKAKDLAGNPGKLLLTVKYSVAQGGPASNTATIRLKTTDPLNREILIPVSGTVNRAPTALIAPLGNGAPGMVVALDGSGSTDADGDLPLTYHWTLRSKPLSSITTIANVGVASTSMTLDPIVPGAYDLALDVTDKTGIKNCAPAVTTVVAAPAQKLLVEMFWDNAKTDLDLHVLQTPTSLFGSIPDDCNYANMNPDWFAPGTMDDPSFIRDALVGYGPELFGYLNPANGTFRIVVDFANEHLSASPLSNATVRVYEYGIVKFEQSHALMHKGDHWIAADVTWPSGEVRSVP